MKEILIQLQELKQQHEDLTSKEIRKVYDEFFSEQSEQVKEILSKDYIPLFFLEKAFVNWMFNSRRNLVKGFYEEYSIFDCIFLREDHFAKNGKLWVYYNKWCKNHTFFSGNVFHQIPVNKEMDGLSFCLFTCKDFPELIQYGMFDPTQFLQLDLEDVGKKNCFIYPTKSGCIVNSYGDWIQFDVPFEQLEGLTVKKIRQKLFQ